MQLNGLWLTYRRIESNRSTRMSNFRNERKASQFDSKTRPVPFSNEVILCKGHDNEAYEPAREFRSSFSYQQILHQPEFAKQCCESKCCPKNHKHGGCCKRFDFVPYALRPSQTSEDAKELLKRRTSYNPMEAAAASKSRIEVHAPARHEPERNDAHELLKRRTSYNPMEASLHTGSRSRLEVHAPVARSVREHENAHELHKRHTSYHPLQPSHSNSALRPRMEEHSAASKLDS